MENLNSADASLAQFHPEISGEHGPFPAPHLSRLWHRTRGGGNRKCVRGRGSVGFCHQQWSKSYSETSEPNQSISPEGFLESKSKDGGKLWETNRGWEGGGGWRTFTSLSPTPFLYSPFFYFTSPPSSTHPVASSRCDSHLLGKKLIFSLGRESPACPLPALTGIGEGSAV